MDRLGKVCSIDLQTNQKFLDFLDSVLSKPSPSIADPDDKMCSRVEDAMHAEFSQLSKRDKDFAAEFLMRYSSEGEFLHKWLREKLETIFVKDKPFRPNTKMAAVFELCKEGKYKQTEIADKLNIAQNTVAVSIKRLRHYNIHVMRAQSGRLFICDKAEMFPVEG